MQSSQIRTYQAYGNRADGCIPELSRFAIRDMGKTVAAGVCMKIDKK